MLYVGGPTPKLHDPLRGWFCTPITWSLTRVILHPLLDPLRGRSCTPLSLSSKWLILHLTYLIPLQASSTRVVLNPSSRAWKAVDAKTVFYVDCTVSFRNKRRSRLLIGSRYTVLFKFSRFQLLDNIQVGFLGNLRCCNKEVFTFRFFKAQAFSQMRDALIFLNFVGKEKSCKLHKSLIISIQNIYFNS